MPERKSREELTERRNFIANTADGALFAFGMSFVSQQTVLPVFVRNIGGGNVAVGLIPVIWTFGFNFTQIFIAAHAQREPQKKALLLKTAMGQRIPWMLLAVIPYFVFPRVGTELALALFFALYGLASLGGGLNLPVWFDLIAHVTPVQRRGRLFALRNLLGGVLGIAGGAVAAAVLATYEYPGSYAFLFSLAFCALMASYYCLTRIVEPSNLGPPAAGFTWGQWSIVTRFIKTRRNYRNFLIGDALLITAAMANAFYTVHAMERFQVPDSYAGTFTVIIMVSTMAGGLMFGMLADRFGHKLNMLLAAGATALACVIALAAPVIEVYGLVFVLSSWSVTLGGISRLPLIAELCTPGERPAYVAVSNMLTSPFVLAGILGGWIANAFGFETVFVFAGLVGGIALVWWSTMVKEPRNGHSEEVR